MGEPHLVERELLCAKSEYTSCTMQCHIDCRATFARTLNMIVKAETEKEVKIGRQEYIWDLCSFVRMKTIKEKSNESSELLATTVRQGSKNFFGA